MHFWSIERCDGGILVVCVEFGRVSFRGPATDREQIGKRRMKRNIALSVVVAVLTAVVPCELYGQATSKKGVFTPEKQMAKQLHHMAQMALQNQGSNPSKARLQIAEILLSESLKLDDTYSETWRMMSQVKIAMEKKDELREVVRGYLKRRPADTSAQMSLVETYITKASDAEKRLEIYGNLLNVGSLKPSVRSRIAIQAAVLMEELGRTKEFASYLKLGLRLDTTNTDAQMMAYRFLRDNDASTRARTAVLGHLAAADPANPFHHAEIAAALLHSGAYKDAVEWFGSTSNLFAVHRIQPDPAFSVKVAENYVRALWGAGRGAEALKLIEAYAKVFGQMEKARREAAKKAGDKKDTKVEEKKGDKGNGKEEGKKEGEAKDKGDKKEIGKNGTRSPLLGLQLHKSLILTSMGEPKKAREAFDTMITALDERDKEDGGNADRLADRIWAHVVLNYDVDKAEGLLEQLKSKLKKDDTRLDRLGGFIKLRKGEKDTARALLMKVAKTDAGAAYGLCLLLDGKDEKTKRISALKEVYLRDPGSLIGLKVFDDVQKLGGRAQASAEHGAVTRQIRTIPEMVKKIVGHRLPIVNLKARAVRAQVGFGDPIEIELELKNVSGIPLNFGTIPRMVLLDGMIMIGRTRQRIPPTVVEIDRKLRLAVRESFALRVRVDTGPLGAFATAYPGTTMQIQIRATLNPNVSKPGTAQQDYVPGFLGARAVTTPILRLGWAGGPDGYKAQLETLKGGDALAAMRAAGSLMRHIAMAEQKDPNRKVEIAKAVSAAYEKMTPIQKAYVQLYVPRDKDLAAMYKSVVVSGVNSKDGLIRIAQIISQSHETTSAVLSEGLREPAGPVKTFADHVHNALVEDDKAKRAREREKEKKKGSGTP